MKLQSWLAMLVFAMQALVACQGQGYSVSPSSDPLPTPASTNTPSNSEIPIKSAATATLTVKGFPDFLEIGFGSIWIANPAFRFIERIDVSTHQSVAKIPIGNPCGAPTVGFDSVWIESCGGVLFRISGKTNEVMAKILVDIADPESSITAGEGGIWILSDKKGVLSRIDPATNKIVATINVKPNSFAVMSGYGAVWVTNTGEPGSQGNGSVQRIDPETNEVVATINVQSQPRFLAVGEGGVWVLNQGDGSVSHIDPNSNTVVATIAVDVPGPGGDIAAGEGAVWVRATKTLLTVIDPKTNQITKRYGPPQGSGAVRARDGEVWVSAHDVTTVWRLNPAH